MRKNNFIRGDFSPLVFFTSNPFRIPENMIEPGIGVPVKFVFLQRNMDLLYDLTGNALRQVCHGKAIFPD